MTRKRNDGGGAGLPVVAVLLALLMGLATAGAWASPSWGKGPSTDRASEILTLRAIQRAGGAFALEELVLLNKFEIQGGLSELEADTLLSRALYDAFVSCVPLTKDQEILLSEYRLFAEARVPDIADLKARLLAERQDHWTADFCAEAKPMLVPGQGPSLSVLPVESAGLALASPSARARGEFLGQGYLREVEPNDTSATATPIVGTNAVVRANVYPNADVDFFSFAAAAGDKVYAAVMTSFSANASTDSQMTLFASDGTTQIEFDDDDGSFGSLSSSIAGATIPAPGTYFLKVNHFSVTGQLRPYELHFRLQSGAPTAEVEPNDTPATANPLPASGWVSGARNPAAAAEQDWYSFTANAGDTVFLSLDLDPERDNVQWNGRLGLALFGDADNQILVVNDGSTGSVANPLSEAFFMTVKNSGTYYAFVDSADAATGGPTATYTLSVAIHPATDEGVNCTTYTSTDVPQTIGPGAGLVSSTITVPGNPRIADLDVAIVLNHALMGDIDAHLRSPAGNDNGLFTDIGASAVGGQAQMDLVLDDEAGIPPAFTVLKGVGLKPELNYRLSWFDGEDAGGTWTLDLRDDGANASGGTLTAWSIRICEPVPDPTCGAGTGPITVFSSDFEADDGGFTHSGTADEWERGLPTFVPITTCNSGVNCWKTDLDNTYDASSSQDLLSPAIDLTNAVPPIQVTWFQKFHMESTSFDRAFVDAQLVGGTDATRLWEWMDATMNDTVGNPTVTIAESAGWARMTADVSAYAGQSQFQLRFHLDSDTTVQLTGLAIDDVTVTACEVLSAGADLAITKIDTPDPVAVGQNLSYTLTVVNIGPDAATNVAVVDTLPAGVTFVSAAGTGWTCGEVAGVVTCTLPSLAVGPAPDITIVVTPTAPGPITNTAVVSATESDPDGTNNTAIATTTVCPVITLAPATLPGGLVGSAYSGAVTASGGLAPYTYAVTGGALPGGLTLNPDGTLTGTPAANGTFTFTVTATDADGCTGSLTYTVVIAAFDLTFYDDYGRSALCVNSSTGAFTYKVLYGFGVGSYGGVGVITRYNGTLYLKTPATSPMVLSLTYMERYRKASASFKYSAMRISSTLYDNNTLNNPAVCAP